jgi:pyrimidine deaminase RibD-like protein
MRHALAQGRHGKPAPNPHVGAVVVRHGRLVGEGHHERAGGPHAEVVALQRAGELARGATLYVTLEPCNHHGRTPPCVGAVLRAGVRRVVIGCADPNPFVSGGGVEALRRHRGRGGARGAGGAGADRRLARDAPAEHLQRASVCGGLKQTPAPPKCSFNCSSGGAPPPPPPALRAGPDPRLPSRLLHSGGTYFRARSRTSPSPPGSPAYETRAAAPEAAQQHRCCDRHTTDPLPPAASPKKPARRLARSLQSPRRGAKQ